MTTQPSGPGPDPEPQRPTESARPPGPRPTESARPSGPRPTGPPSGPLSGGRQGPPPTPPAPPSGGTPPGPPPEGPWWRSVPRLATALVAVAALVALVVVLTRPSGTPSARGEVFLQPASATGPDPFTESTAAREAVEPPQSPAPSPTGATPTTAATATANATRSISGAAPGLYGGTQSVTSCDVEKQVRALSAEPAKNEAFASALGIRPQSVPGYLRSLTPVQLRTDTRVTNHGYRDGKATAYQAVLQAGTAVLIDDRGVPRVRCACGNPLGPPVALPADPKRHGQPWSWYQPSEVVVIAPSETVVRKFVIYDHHDRSWFERNRGDHRGEHDRPVPPPVLPPAPATPSHPAPATSATSATPASPPASSHSPAEKAPVSPPPPTPPSGPPSKPASEPPSEPASKPASEPASAPASKEASKPATEPVSEPPPGSPPDTGTPSARAAAE
ncbi:DUF6777 domain-containing protein [Streptomyces sp. NPDC056492]|uniref:DUF6777 domain-containing protein n=1 Tax=unclassified Streptomyces TaxID=2593676 RepID=UPI0036BDECF9